MPRSCHLRPRSSPRVPSSRLVAPLSQSGLGLRLQLLRGQREEGEGSLELGWKLWPWACCQPGRSSLFGGCQSERVSRRPPSLLARLFWWPWLFYVQPPSLSLWPS